MSRVIECIFENNVLKPLEKVPLNLTSQNIRRIN